MSNGSYLEVYFVTNGEPVQLRQNRRDKRDFWATNQGYSEQAGGGPGLKQMCQRGENCNNQAVTQLKPMPLF